jgi:hypothetical protein
MVQQISATGAANPKSYLSDNKTDEYMRPRRNRSVGKLVRQGI